MPRSSKAIADGLAAALIHAVDAKVAPAKATRARRAPTVPPKSLPCYFCGGPILGLDGFIEFCAQEVGPPYLSKTAVRFNEHGGREERGALAWPANGDDLVASGKWTACEVAALFTHTNCGPDIGYSVPFGRLDEDWERHLAHKRWVFLGMYDAFDIAREHAGVRRPVRR